MSLVSFFRNPEQRTLILTGMLGFALIGALQSLYGPIFPLLQARFDLSPGSVGLIVSSHFLGAVLVIATGGLSLRSFGYRRVLAAGGLLMFLGSLGVAFSPQWQYTLVAAFIGGLGFGSFEVGGNLLFTRSFGAQGTPLLNLIHAMFGIGAILGPSFIALATPNINLVFIGFALCCLVLSFLSYRLKEPARSENKHHVSYRFPFLGLGGFAIMYFLYVAAEIGVASWESSHLAPIYGEARAAFFTSIYWGALTLGRFMMSFIGSHFKARTIVLASTVFALLSLILAHNSPLAPFAYALTGLAFAPLFPTGLVWLQDIYPERAEQLTPIVIAVANAGAIFTPPVIGVIVGLGSSQSIPTTLAGLVFLLVIATLILFLSLKPKTP